MVETTVALLAPAVELYAEGREGGPKICRLRVVRCRYIAAMVSRRARRLRPASLLLLFACGGHEAGDAEPPLSRLGPTPVSGFSRSVQLPNGDAMIIPIDYELIVTWSIDSSTGVLEDPKGNPMGYYDIGSAAGTRVGPELQGADAALFGVRTGTEEQSVNQVFYYLSNEGTPDEPGGWVATFAERGPANFWGEPVLSREEFLGWMRTYTSSGEVVE